MVSAAVSFRLGVADVPDQVQQQLEFVTLVADLQAAVTYFSELGDTIYDSSLLSEAATATQTLGEIETNVIMPMDRWVRAFSQGGPSPIGGSVRAFKTGVKLLHIACVEGDSYAAKLHYRSANAALMSFVKMANLQSPPGSQLEVFPPAERPYSGNGLEE